MRLTFPLPVGRRPTERGRHYFGLRGIVGRGGIGSHGSPFPCLPAAICFIGRDGIGSRCSPFPCLPAASLQEPENAERLLFYFGVQLRVNPAALQNKKAATSSQLFRLLRRERDSNPRYSYPYTAFRVRPDRPLRHLSFSVAGGGLAPALPTQNRCFGTANIDIFFIFAHFRAEKITFG